MEIIGKISKGSRMDQIYIPKNRCGFSIGEYVLILPLESRIEKKIKIKPYFYNVEHLESIKLKLIEEIFSLINKTTNPKEIKNVIVTGSFLEEGFNFNDIDILIICEKKLNIDNLKSRIGYNTGIKTHLLLIDNESLIKGLSTDPLYQLMLNKCVSEKRLIYKVQRKVNYKVLDLHLLKSKTLIDNFDILSGSEKYYLTMNLVAILHFLENRKLSKEQIDKQIKILLGIDVKRIKENLLNKQDFLKKYKKIYNKTFSLIFQNIKNGKQK